MNNRSTILLLLTALALIFTVGLTFASIELPRLLDTFLATTIDTPDVATGLNEMSDFKTELYLGYYNLRLIGYCCLALIVILIAVGFATERSGWTSAGALLLFLPVFGHFAATMFFLGGLGFLRLLWLPALDVSFNAFRLGDVIKIPHEILSSIVSSLGLNPDPALSYALTGAGLLIFLLGTVTWFYARVRKCDVADFWVYRLSRHPQYLGWIVWSYGVLYLPGPNIKLCYGLSNSLPWLLSTMTILGVAMLEELRMKESYGDRYESYRRRAPFLFPLPRIISRAFTLPLRLAVKKDRPERKREILGLLAFYTFLCLGISLFSGGFVPFTGGETSVSRERIETLARVLKESGDLGAKWEAAGELEKIGEPALDVLLALLNDPVPQVRAYAAGALGGTTSRRVITPLVALLDDSDSYVRRTAAGSLGRSGSELAIPSLVRAMQDPKNSVANAALRALGGIRHPDVVPYLVEALRDTTPGRAGAAASALGEIGFPDAIEPLTRCFEEMPGCPYDVVGEALWKLNSNRAIDAWILGLRKGSWWYTRAACAASMGRVRSEKGIEPLIEAVRDLSPEVRRAAVLALMEVGSEKARGALEEATRDLDLEVRIYAEESLRRIGVSR